VTEPGLVTAVLIVRNGERFLGQALDSVRAQTYRPIETIVVDGNSTDGTAALARARSDVRVLTQHGAGIAAAYNTGIGAARGEYLAFLSHDDLWVPEKLALQVDVLRTQPQVQYTVGMLRYFLEPGCEPPRGMRRDLLQGIYVGRVMETLVARRTLFEEVGGFDSALRIANDVDWFARVQDLGVPGVVLRELLLHKRVHEANTSANETVNTAELLTVLGRSIVRRRQREPRAR
jgi:glycosyltransferase involved in cell wall biosynthesis